jgi:hypothetical protein
VCVCVCVRERERERERERYLREQCLSEMIWEFYCLPLVQLTMVSCKQNKHFEYFKNHCFWDISYQSR